MNRSKVLEGKLALVGLLAGAVLCWMPAGAHAQEFFKASVDEKGGLFRFSNGITLSIAPGTFGGPVGLQVILRTPPEGAANIVTDAVSVLAVSVLAVSGDATLHKPIELRIPLAATPAKGQKVEVWHLTPGGSFPDINQWIPRTPVSAKTWHTSDPIAFPDNDEWLVGYKAELGWQSGSPEVHLETNRLGTLFVAGLGGTQ